MSALIPFDSTPPTGSAVAEVPAHLVALFGDSANITAKFNIDQLSYRGKIWRRVVAGEEVALTRTNTEGDTEPIPIVNLIVLDHNKGRSRSFYEGAFEEGKSAAPRCYSGDGVTPDSSVKEPCAATCAVCPNAVKGSKITENGKQTTLCSPFKRVAVIPSDGIGAHPAMLLRLAQTSVWDKDNGENEAKGWYAWDQYLDMLRARGAKHTAVVETRAKFDIRMAYPKLLFSASRWLSQEEGAAVKALIVEKSKDVADILSGGDRDGMAGLPAAAANSVQSITQQVEGIVQTGLAKAQTFANAATAPKAAAPKPPAKPAATPAPVKRVPKMTAKAGEFTYEQMLAEGWDHDTLLAEGMVEMVPEAATAPKPPAKPKGPPKPPAKQGQLTLDGGHLATAASSPPAPAPSSPATVMNDTPAGLADLLNSWDDDAAS